MLPILYIIVPCYNDEDVLPLSSKLYLNKLQEMIANGSVDDKSRIMLVNDGSKDKTWNVICELANNNQEIVGISQSRNRGHQSTVLAGLMEAKDKCDITISIDSDGQDDVNAMDEMVQEYKNGAEIVYGVRSSREVDRALKRFTAQAFYKILRSLGAETVYNHADYRLVSTRVLREFENFKEVNLYLRGMFPLVGFKSTSVYYKRLERMAGESHYSLSKLVALAIDGITSLSIKPLHIITGIGLLVSLVSFLGVIWSFISSVLGNAIEGWASMTCIICFLGGVQLISLGVLGEYIGKIYMEVKARPRYIISERTYEDSEKNI